MFRVKEDHECVSVLIKRMCGKHRESISEMQEKIRKESKGSRLPGKGEAIKSILNEYENQKLIINELRAQLKECMDGLAKIGKTVNQ